MRAAAVRWFFRWPGRELEKEDEFFLADWRMLWNGAAVNGSFFNLLRLLLSLALFSCAWAGEGVPGPPPSEPVKVVVIPVREQIAQPAHYVLRRGLKDAISAGADAVVLDMDTPGGRLDVTLEMIEALMKFPGKTFTFVNNEAISAGAYIAAATREIHLTPDGLIGAAAPVSATGEDVDKVMTAKILSYLKAKVRSMSDENSYRAQVLSAMADMNYELKIGEEVISPKGELLTLTAKETMKTFGDPPQALLGSGIHPDINSMLDAVYGKGGYSITRVEASWSEQLAQFITNLTPILLAVGMLLLVAEFKTPGFGVMGFAGAALLGVVFFGHYTAGLSGHEPAIFFVVGVLLLVAEVFFLPGMVVPAVTGAALILGSLVWGMADLWPNEPLSLSGEVFIKPLVNVMIAVVLTGAGFFVLVKFLPGKRPWSMLVLQTAVGGEPVAGRPIVAAEAAGSPSAAALIGRAGIAVTPLFPSGQVEIDARRYEARAEMGSIPRGARVTVARVSECGLIVEEDAP